MYHFVLLFYEIFFSELPQFIDDFDQFVTEFVTPYLTASAAIGGVIDEQVN